MPDLHIIDSLTDAGHSARINEDALAWNASAAFVLDGATTLGPSAVAPPLTDAAWLSRFVSDRLRDGLVAGMATADAIRSAIDEAARQFGEMAGDAPEPWQLPVASLLGVRSDGALFGLGDAVAFIREGDAAAVRWTPSAYVRDTERDAASAALARNGGFSEVGAAYDEAQALQDLRRKRMFHNQPGGASWLVGVVPEAADHLRVRPLHLSAEVTLLLCTDGFAELADHYGRYDADGLIDAVLQRGLQSLCAELRHIERHEDPDGVRYPRFKQSDDATALLVRLI